MADKHYVGEIGTEILVDCGCDISGASPTTLKVKKPDGTEVEWTATISGTDYLTYTITTDDLDQAGVYYLHSYLTLSGWVGLGERAAFIIYDPYEDDLD